MGGVNFVDPSTFQNFPSQKSEDNVRFEAKFEVFQVVWVEKPSGIHANHLPELPMVSSFWKCLV